MEQTSLVGLRPSRYSSARGQQTRNPDELYGRVEWKPLHPSRGGVRRARCLAVQQTVRAGSRRRGRVLCVELRDRHNHSLPPCPRAALPHPPPPLPRPPPPL